MAQLADKVYESLKSKPIEIFAVVLGIISTGLITYTTIVNMKEKKRRKKIDEIQEEMLIIQYNKLKQEAEGLRQ
jgi:hypothetical protein